MSKTILVDHRWGQAPERRDAFIQEMELHGYHCVQTQLTTGDLVWSCPLGRVGVEMKGLRDLCVSHYEGRLDDELYRLQREFAVPVLLVTEPLGYAANVPEGSFTFQAIDHLLLGRQTRGILVAHCGDIPLAVRVAALIEYLDRPQRGLIRPKRQHFPYMGKMTDRAEVVYALLSAVKNVRDKVNIAARLADTVSLAEVFSGDEVFWRERGFSRLMAQRLSAFCREA